MSPRDRIAELFVPGLRWDEGARQYRCEGATLDEALEAGVGGFCLFGGTADAARETIAAIRARSRVDLLFCADLERGAGQQLDGLTGLPPLAALGWLGEELTMLRAGALTAREARSVGIDWVFGPVLDLDIEPDNPIVGTRSMGSDPAVVATLAESWIAGCQLEGVLACAKHFPGHGRTVTDSHATLPVVRASAAELASDLVPFQAAVDAGCAGIMTAHVAYPALDPSGVPATLSRAILGDLLRSELGFTGLVFTDAMIMEGLGDGGGEGAAAARALACGVDMLVYPRQLASAVRGIAAACERGELDEEDLAETLANRETWLGWSDSVDGVLPRERTPLEDERRWAREVAVSAIHTIRGTRPSLRGRVSLAILDDDIGGPHPPPSREPFVAALRAAGLDVAVAEQASPATNLIALFGDIRGWKGRPGYSAETLARLRALVDASPGAAVVQFSHPRLAASLPGDTVVCAWGGEPAMQEAAARWLAGSERR